MNPTMVKEQGMAATADPFTALEQRVVRAIELLNREREQRISIEKQLAEAREQLEVHHAQSTRLSRELEELHRERDTIRNRVERMMASLDAVEHS